ncbi:hypothetical protein AVCANL279_07305 [Campylobacter canadensis]|uniref:DnaB-like helicase C-terminal domain-containing protein n=1 Tax=Campylobacter canadensis TaxID=449520 RepID=UPI001557F7B5|nr:DnaB-like helicase C-terminal domain-containing protein [Campylobacter canadensis]MBZ7995178.1 hypothetical protein [Campylobacter canadensis]MBZ7997125.1 hypothetical protein [Campylobacter canadensis]MBZ8003853.1 hypothetical protein [Campylobacter canadensis]
MNNEEVVLNACIQIQHAFIQVRQMINEKAFSNTNNKEIFTLLGKIIDDGKSIDLATLILYAENEKKDFVINHILNIVSKEPSFNYLDFAKRINIDECLKAQQALALKLLDASKNGNLINYDDIINSIKVPRKQIYKSASQLYKEMKEEIINIKHYKSGISVVDNALKGGFQTGSFVLVSGEPEAGKSMFALQVIENIANQKIKAAYFCFEFLARDYIKLKMNIDDNMRYLTPFYEKENFQNLTVISDDYGLNEVANKIRDLSSLGTKFFLIDSQMRIENKEGRSLEEEESRKFSTLAKLAHSLDICIILIVQTNKTDTQTPSGTKKGAHEANVIIRIETEKTNGIIKPTERYIIIQKNKQSGTHDKYHVEFNPISCQFGNRIINNKITQEIL